MRWLKTIVCLLLAAAFPISAAAVDVSAKSAILYEASTGKILYQKDIHTQRDIASTTKIMTALVTIENARLDEVVTVKASCTGIEGTSMYLKPGEKLTVNTLLHGLMLQSGNDAAVTLADHVGGSVDKFVSMMNAEAQRLGLSNTRFQNPNGLTAQGHYSSALDMAKLAAYAMGKPEFRAIVSAQKYQAEGRYLSNHNRLLRMMDEVDGVKTGFTKAAGRCLVSSAVKDGMRLVAVTLADPNDWDDHIALYHYGFSNFAKRIFIQPGKNLADIPVAGSNGAALPVAAVGELSGIFPSAQADDAKMEILLPRFVYAPVSAGQVIGEARLVAGGTVLAKTSLVSAAEYRLPEKVGLWDRIIDFFNFRN